MKQIFPTQPSTIKQIGTETITKKQYEELVEIVNNYKNDFDLAVSQLNTFKEELRQHVVTDNVDTSTLSAETIDTLIISTDTLEVNNISDFIDLLTKSIQNGSLKVQFNPDSFTVLFDNNKSIEVKPNEVLIYKNLAIDGDIDVNGSIAADNAELDGDLTVHGNVVFDNPPEQIDANLTGTTSIENADIENAVIDTAQITHIEGTEAQLQQIVTDILEADIFLNNDYTRIAHNYHKHEPQQVQASLQDYWIVIPNFKNGEYYLYSECGEELDWSFECFNSIDNPMFRWSERSLNRIKQVILQNFDDGTARIVLRIGATNELAKIYCASNSFEIAHYTTGWNSPTIYNYRPYTEGKEVDINDLKGTYIPNATYAGEFHAEGMVVDNFIFNKLFVKERIGFPVESGTENYDVGKEGDYITNVYDEEADETRVEWVSPTNNKTPTAAIERDKLITEATLGNYTGEMTSERAETVVNDYDSLVADGTYYYKDGGNYVAITSKSTETNRSEYIVNALTQDDADVLVAQGVYLFEDPDYVAITSIDVENKTINGTDYSAEWETMSIYGHEVVRYFINDTYLVTFPLTVYGTTSTEYNVKHLGDDTTVHGSIDVTEDADIEGNITVEGDTRTKHIYDGATIPDDLPNDSLVIDDTDEKLYRKRDFVIEDQTVSKFDELAVKNSDYADWADMNGKPVVYNKDRDAIEPSDALTIDNLEVDDLKVNNNLDVGNDVRIAGDLYVSGTTHTVTEETIESKSDTIVLREGNPNGLLPGQQSGIIINNYDGNDNDLSIVSDETGTLRVGTGTGTSTVLTNVAYNSSTGKWYSFVIGPDDEKVYTEITPQPSGAITATTGKTEEDPYTVYDSVTFTVIDKTTLQPILTRDEEANMADNGILVFDKDNVKAKTLPVPTVSGQVLTAEYDDAADEMGYQWKDPSASIFRFATYTDYQTALAILPGNEGYIPDGSLIIIDGDHNYLRGPDGYVEP